LYISKYWGNWPSDATFKLGDKEIILVRASPKNGRREIIFTDFKLDTYWKKEKDQKQEGKCVVRAMKECGLRDDDWEGRLRW
jgi:hypothetical protein